MSKTTNKENKEILETLNAISENLKALNTRVSNLEKSANTTKASSSNSSKKKSVSNTKTESEAKTESQTESETEAESQTRAERLEEKYGDLETRKKFIELRNRVSKEFKSLAEKEGLYIPKKQYRKVLASATEACNGKFNKSIVRKHFLASAK